MAPSLPPCPQRHTNETPVSGNSTQRHQNARNVTYLKDILLKAVLITIKPVNLESGLLMSRRPHHRVQDSVEKLSPPLVYDVASVQPVIQERKKKRTASERASESLCSEKPNSKTRPYGGTSPYVAVRFTRGKTVRGVNKRRSGTRT